MISHIPSELRKVYIYTANKVAALSTVWCYFNCNLKSHCCNRTYRTGCTYHKSSCLYSVVLWKGRQLCKHDSQCTLNVIMRYICVNIVAVEKQYCKIEHGSVALVIEHAMLCAVLCCHLWPIWPCHIFPHYPKAQFSRGKQLLNMMCILIYLCVSGIFLILRRIQHDIVINVHRFSCKGPIILVRFSSNLNFLNRFLKNTQIPNFILKNLFSVS